MEDMMEASYIAVVGLRAPPRRSLEEVLYKFSERMNECCEYLSSADSLTSLAQQTH